VSTSVRATVQPLVARMGPWLARTYLSLSQPPAPNLWGDRHVEYAFVAAHIPLGPGLGLDFGSGDSNLALVAVERGLRMIAADRVPTRIPFEHPNFSFVQTDAFDLNLARRSLDLIINCSTIEHLGLGRYRDQGDPDGDLVGMRRLHDLLKPSGVMLLTTPVGLDAVHSPLHRVYGRARLPRLLEHWTPTSVSYWAKNSANRWTPVREDEALSWQSSAHSYALGCFVLAPAAAEPSLSAG